MPNTITKIALMGSTTFLGAAIFAMPGFAQAAQDSGTGVAKPTAVASADEQVIIVTGSRIARPELAASVPVVVVGAAEIQSTGAGNIQDTLSLLPAVGQNFSRTSSNFSSTGNGEATINLRNLGSSRTLVLINGRRSVGIAGTSAVDLNNIPTDFIDRVEVITGGASATYGSEAIAGVVNFILKDKFEGILVNGQGTISGRGDAARQRASVTGGYTFGGDRGHVIANFIYDRDEGLRSRDRSFSERDIPNRSSYAAQGLFSFDGRFSAANGKTFTFAGDNSLKPYQGANIDGYNRNADRYLSVPVERYQGALIGNYKLFDDIKLYVEGEYTRTHSNNGLEPEAESNTAANPIVNFDGTPLRISINNPYVPAALRAAAVAAGVTSFDFRRRSNDIFSRSNDDKREYYRGVVGVGGAITNKLSFDLSYEHSESIDNTQSQSILARNYGAALNAVRDAGGNIICADAAARAAGCVPINIFGFNTVSAAAATWVRTDPGPASGGITKGALINTLYHAKSKQDVVSGTITGSLFDLPGGPLDVSAGGEYRRESSAETFDPYTQQGLTTGNQLGNIVGKFNVKEVFGELVAPIIADRPGFAYLGAEGAIRYADYSTVGGVTSWKAGGTYAPVKDIRFRSIYARATRAPNIGELYTSQSQTFPAVIDPCDQRQGNGDGAPFSQPLSAACRAIPGVLNTVARDGGFGYTTAQIQTIDGLTGGNTNLRQETAATLTAGVVVTPSFFRGFTFTADFYSIKVKNAVGIIGQQISATQCIATGLPVFCNNIIRDGDGFIKRVNALNLNTGSNFVQGLDFDFNYNWNLGMVHVPGALAIDVKWNHLLKQQQVPYPGGDIVNEINQADCYSCGRLGTGFRNKVTGNFVYVMENFKFTYRGRYLSRVFDNLDGSVVPTRIKPYYYQDIEAEVAVGADKRFTLYGGVNNLTDRTPPIFNDTNQVTWPGTQTVADTYDLYGRILYAGFRAKF